LLILGSARTMMSLVQYKNVRLFVGLLNIKLTGYKSLQNCCHKLKKKYHLNLLETSSPLGTQCFARKVKQILKQELGNPYMREFLEFIPILPTAKE
ncbi:hypothetical protein DFH28DRAFT_882527, partial [Melampsora americana]